ncbi:unnamed protein product [Strongylus vulgaris]|uniref:Uncharacterized protein n=1 Tax=Strongylus vulgaris TaxID=40348 RepID=A0A3P7IJL2_STRVU|nr:unnamed protein product [Strongylus vulgaris]
MIRAPKVGGKAATWDPNYQTLAGLNNDEVFKAKDDGKFKGGGGGASPNIKAPKVGGKAATWDPNYQTLAGLKNEDIFKPKGGGGYKGGGGGIKLGGGGMPKVQKPAQHKVVATNDPNYQTLAGINADVFGEDKKKKQRNIDRWATY